MAFLFRVLQERQNLGCSQIGQADLRNRLRLPCRCKPKKQSPAVTVRKHGVMGSVALLHQPIVEKSVKEFRKRGSGRFHAFPPVEARGIRAPRTRNRSLACCSSSWVMVRYTKCAAAHLINTRAIKQPTLHYLTRSVRRAAATC